MRCKHCANSSGERKRGKELEKEELLSIADKICVLPTAQEVAAIEGLGINCTEPSMDDIKAGMEMAQILGITYCYRELTPKTTIYW